MLNRATIFYATPEELTAWLSAWGNRYDLHAMAGRVFPLPEVVTEVPWEDRQMLLRLVMEQATFYLNLKPMMTDVPSVNQIASRNPDCLTIHVPKSTGNTLGYGAISSAATDADSIRIWRGILKDIFASTNKGVWFGVPKQVKQTFERDVRFSAGAAQLFLNGIRLLGGGKTIVRSLGGEKT